jgi:hypothetical protein
LIAPPSPHSSRCPSPIRLPSLLLPDTTTQSPPLKSSWLTSTLSSIRTTPIPYKPFRAARRYFERAKHRNPHSHFIGCQKGKVRRKGIKAKDVRVINMNSSVPFDRK